MDMSTNSGGHSQQLSMMRDNMNDEPYRFNFMNVSYTLKHFNSVCYNWY